EVNHHTRIISWRGYGLNPLRNIIHNNQNIEIRVRSREWSHEINTLYIEYFYLKDEILGHLLLFGYVPCPLTLIAAFYKGMSVFEDSWPMKTTLKNLSCGSITTEMTTIFRTIQYHRTE
ncbi:hypothetical protein PIB30_104084, partial [Stylosanthes scabra]|nr:hypothetical protein [Stylosanthes scabra]